VNAKSIKNLSPSKTNWKKLRQKNDADINYSNIPETDKQFWKSAKVILPPHKIHLSVRFDEDIVNYFKKKGKGYQSKMNAVLRAYMSAHQKHA
jgi:uncharacterized protein (DUF4415 family)